MRSAATAAKTGPGEVVPVIGSPEGSSGFPGLYLARIPSRSFTGDLSEICRAAQLSYTAHSYFLLYAIQPQQTRQAARAHTAVTTVQTQHSLASTPMSELVAHYAVRI